MKLSEAIRLGGMMKPQGRGGDSLLSLDAPCALGGALQSIGKQPKDQRGAYRIIGETWQFIHGPAKCPCGHDHFKMLVQWSWIKKVLFRTDSGTRETILVTIVLLNDCHRLTRNQIADWVATVEPDEEVKAEEVKQEVWRFIRK